MLRHTHTHDGHFVHRRTTSTLLVYYAYPCWSFGHSARSWFYLLLSVFLISCMAFRLEDTFLALIRPPSCTTRFYLSHASCLSRYHHTLGYRLSWSTDQLRLLDYLFATSLLLLAELKHAPMARQLSSCRLLFIALLQTFFFLYQTVLPAMGWSELQHLSYLACGRVYWPVLDDSIYYSDESKLEQSCLPQPPPLAIIHCDFLRCPDLELAHSHCSSSYDTASIVFVLCHLCYLRQEGVIRVASIVATQSRASTERSEDVLLG